MALFRKFFYKKPPEGLLEISEGVYVFDCCCTADVPPDENEFKVYMSGIATQLKGHLPNASFMVFNFRDGEGRDPGPSPISQVLSEYDMTVMDYPRGYYGGAVPLLTMEMVHHFLRSSESWLSLGPDNVLLVHCEEGGWPVLAFMLAALLVYRRQYTGEKKTLEMIYKQAPTELVQVMCPVDPVPSQLRYLQYVSRRSVVGSEGWPPKDTALTLDRVNLRVIPDFDGQGGCRPVFRVYGQEPSTEGTSADAQRTGTAGPKVLFSTPRLKTRYYKKDCELVKIDIRCHIQGDVVLECVHLAGDDGGGLQQQEEQQREEEEVVMFRVMFNTAFIRSNILVLHRNDFDIVWDAKDRFSTDFRAEVIFSDIESAASVITVELAACDGKEGLPVEAFSRVQEIFSNVDWLETKPGEPALQDVLQQIKSTNSKVLVEASAAALGLGPPPETPSPPPRTPTAPKEKQEPSGSKPDSHQVAAGVPTSISPLGKDPLAPKLQNDLLIAIQRAATSQPQLAAAVAPRRGGLGPSRSAPPTFGRFSLHMPRLSRYLSAPSALGITALLWDHGGDNAGKAATNLREEDEEETCATNKPPAPVMQLITAWKSLGRSAAATAAAAAAVVAAETKTGTGDTSTKPDAASPKPTPTPVSGAPSPAPALPSHQKALPPSRLASVSQPTPPTPPAPPALPQHHSGRQPGAQLNPPPPPPQHPRSSTTSTAPPPPPPPPSFPSSSATSTTPPPPPPPSLPRPSTTSTAPPPPTPSLPRPSTASPGPPPPPPPSLPRSSTASPGPPPPPPPLGKETSPGPPVPPPPGRTQARAPPFPGGSPSPSISKRTSLKPLHWVKVTRAMKGSLWAEAQKQDEASKPPEFDMSELETLFSAAIPSAERGRPGEKSGKSSVGQKSERIHLIDLRRANNCEIMLTKVKIPLPDLMSSVLAMDDSILDGDQVENLIKFCPTKEEMELLKNFNGDIENLGKCEQFFLEMMKVPRVESKLRVFSFKIQFQGQATDLRSSLNIVNSAAEEIRNSVKLKRIMQTILSLGNALNQGTARGSAVGFRLDSLLKLTDTRSRNSRMTLMHYLCKVLADKMAELLEFHKDLVSLEAATKIQLKTLAEEMQAISKGLEKTEQELTASENDGPVSLNFCKILKDFLITAEAEVRALTSLYSGVGRNADALALYFGEDPARCPFEQVVTTLFNFMKMFVRAHEDNCRQIEIERKKAQKEAENEKMKVSSPRTPRTPKTPRRFEQIFQSSFKNGKT